MIRNFKPRLISLRVHIYKHLSDLFPLAVAYAFLQIIVALFLKPNSFFPMTLGIDWFEKMWWLDHLISDLSSVILCLLYSLFVTLIVCDYLGSSKSRPLPTIFSFLFTWLMYSTIHLGMGQKEYTYPAWMLLIGTSVLIVALVKLGRRFFSKIPYMDWITFIGGIYGTQLLANKFTFRDILTNLQGLWSLAVSWEPVHYYSVAAWSLVGPVCVFLGIPVPEFLSNPTADLASATTNMTAVLSKQKVPYPFTLYTLQNSFAIIGGVGFLFGLALSIYIFHKKQGKRLGARYTLSVIAMLFNQPLPFLMAYPILLNPILLIPMLLSTLVSIAIGVLAIYSKVVFPSLYTVPTGTPHILFAYLASNACLGYLILIPLVIAVSTTIYYPFVKKLYKEDVISEKA